LEQYLLSEALVNAPPALVVLSDGVSHPAADGVTAVAGSDDYRLADGGSFAAGVLDSSAPASTAAGVPLRAGRPTRPRRREKNPLAEVAKIVLGGVLGLTIGLLVLWHAFGKDPLDAGPTVARYAPFIVPAQFRGLPKPSVVSDLDSPSSPPTSRPAVASESNAKRPPKRGSKPPTSASSAADDAQLITLPTLDEGPAPRPASELKIEDPLNNSHRSATPKDEARSLSPAPTGRRGGGGVAQASTVSELHESAEPARPIPDLTELLDAIPFTKPPITSDTPSPVSPEDLRQAVGAASAALGMYEELPSDDKQARRDALNRFLTAAAEMGRGISYLEPSAVGVIDSVEHIEQMLRRLTSDDGQRSLETVAAFTRQQWARRADDQGLLATGAVKSFASAGAWHRLVLDAGSAEKPLALPIITVNDPKDLCQVGDQLLCLGRVVDAPARRLAGYKGDEPRVLVAGFSLRLPTTK
jgi:hypothetical protein